MDQVSPLAHSGSIAESLIATIRQPFLILDSKLYVRAANQCFYDTFRTDSNHTINSPIFELGNRQWDIFNLRRLLSEVLPEESEVKDFEVRHTFPAIGPRIMRLNARRLVQDKNHEPFIFLSIEDVSSKVASAGQTSDQLDFAESIIETLRDPLVVLDKEFHVFSANSSFFETFQVSREETYGRKIYDLGNGQWEIPKLHVFLEKTLAVSESFRDFEVEHVFPRIGRKIMLLNGRRITDRGQNTQTILLVIEDITERRRQEEFIYFQAAALNSVHDAVVAVDRQNRITYWNEPAEKLFQENRSSVIGRSIDKICSLIQSESTSGPEAVFACGPEAGKWIEHHIRIKKSAREVWLESSTNEIAADDLSPGRLIVLRDVTAKKRSDLELCKKNEDLELFASLASHDLQEPLRMVSAYVSLLAKRYQGKLDSNADEYIKFAVEGTLRMRGLITDLLRYARTQTYEDRLALVGLNRLVSSALQDLQIAIRESGAEIQIDELPEVVVDAGLMRQVFQNLLGNSIKYRSKDRTLTIKIGAVRDDGRGWVIHVKDNGIGFDNAHAHRIFRLFQRLEPRTETSGTGIGLTMTKKIIEAHGGRIWVDSSPGVGTSFFFSIPFRSCYAGT